MPIHKIGVISRRYRHIERYRQIISVLFKYGFGDILDALHIGRNIEIALPKRIRRRQEQIEELTLPERVRMAMEELGPTFIKMGQILSHTPREDSAETLKTVKDKVEARSDIKVVPLKVGEVYHLK